MSSRLSPYEVLGDVTVHAVPQASLFTHLSYSNASHLPCSITPWSLGWIPSITGNLFSSNDAAAALISPQVQAWWYPCHLSHSFLVGNTVSLVEVGFGSTFKTAFVASLAAGFKLGFVARFTADLVIDLRLAWKLNGSLDSLTF